MASLLPSLTCLVFLVSLACARHVQYTPDDLSSEEKLLELFEHWIHRHSKNYTAPGDGSSEKHSRFQIFKQNVIYIHHRNQGPHSHRLGLNRFADLTLDEFKAKHLGFRLDMASTPANLPRQRRSACSANGVPASVDWRHKGAVTPVKDQGHCGSCWAFSSVGAIEGAHAVATGELVSLSEQELVSCVHNNFGCNGGYMDRSFEWVIKNKGINTEDGYPYVSGGTGKSKTCNWLKKAKKVVTIDSYVDVDPNDEDALLCAVAQQPVSVAINAGSYDFQLYAGGVFNATCSDDPDDINHALLVVGYGSSNGKDHWIVKNSWSKEWGLDGYVLMQRSTGNPRGLCGIHSFPSYPVAKGSSANSVSIM